MIVKAVALSLQSKVTIGVLAHPARIAVRCLRKVRPKIMLCRVTSPILPVKYFHSSMPVIEISGYCTHMKKYMTSVGTSAFKQL